MSPNKNIAEFPDVEAKLQKPSKQSAFERQKAEAEAKRKREAAETAAVYDDFVKSFNHDDDDNHNNTELPFGTRQGPRSGSGPPERSALGGQTPFGGGAGKRHFGIPLGTPKSGPGSLGPSATSLGKRRQYEASQWAQQRDTEESRGRLGFEDHEPASLSQAFASDEDMAAPATDRAEEKAISKPTLRLANLPPGTSSAFIKTLIPPSLSVENVKVVPVANTAPTERKSIAAIVTLSKETPATDIDAAVNTLQNRYLGFGYFLSLYRHLSSAAIASGLETISTSASVSHPFGARPVKDAPRPQGPQSLGQSRGFAPPSSYGPPLGGSMNRSGLLHVPIRPPKDIKKLRMIHKVIESVIEHGPEFEALLMSRPDVQRDEKWAWIWDARSEGGIWYRWRLWEIITGPQSRPRYIPLFEGSHAWKAPEQSLAYEYASNVDEFVSDSEYNSSDDDDIDDDQVRHCEGGSGINEQEDTFLNPLDKAKLAHLLARLPTALSKIRKGDTARITAFAITHASRGADEIVDMIISNIELPFAYTSANPDHKARAKDKDGQDKESRGPSPTPDDKAVDSTDMSAARLLGLYVVSDILSSSSTSGIRHAWRYRQLFETALRSRRTFELLGSMADKLNWGRLRADKWKRSVGLVLNLWEGWCVFPVESHSFFVRSFENPPLPPKAAEKSSNRAKREAGRWKPVETSAVDGGYSSINTSGGFAPVSEGNTPNHLSPETEGQDYINSVMGTRTTEDDMQSPQMQYSSGVEDLFSDEDLDGRPDEDFLELVRGTMKQGDAAMGGLNEGLEGVDASADSRDIKSIAGFQMSAAKTAPRKRMRAVDLFASSESDGDG